MNDYQIRTALKHKTFVRYNNDPETLILDELGLRHGAARIDIAVLNGRLHGFEIKSDRDTLKPTGVISTSGVIRSLSA